MYRTPRTTHRLSLDKAVEYLLEECRIVLPGIQVLFGFQLATVFTDPLRAGPVGRASSACTCSRSHWWRSRSR